MVSRLTLGNCILAVLFLAIGVGTEAADLDLWQGAFKTARTWGAMELRLSHDGSSDRAHLKIAPDARPLEPEIGELRLTDQRISFITTIAATRYRFEGARRDSRWAGTLIAMDGGSDRGTWAVSRLNVEDASAIAKDPLPAATGRYPTGRAAFQWVDDARPELETRVPEDRRELLVYGFYPSEESNTLPPAPYMPEADVMLPYWKDDLTNRLKTVRADSREGVAVAASPARFPVVIFAPGGGQKALAYTTLLEDLASHGYVVAAIEPPYNAPAMQFPNGRTIGRLGPADRGWDEPKTRDDMPRIYEQMVLHWARDMSFVLDRLTELNTASQGSFAGRLDLARVGAFGHSRGGQAAGTVRLLDPRFRGGVNLDGNIRGRGFQPIKGPDGGQQPFMWIEKHTPVLNDKELEQAQLPKARYQEFFVETNRLMQSVQGGSAHVTVARIGIEHLDFSDNPFWNVVAPPDVRAAKRQTLAVTRACVRAFFDGCLRGQWNELRGLVAEAGAAHPEVSSRTFGRMWPD
ncbi:MAG: alpha/beta hydrolase family protein [Vicinamibacterales bacterium]